jgi:hypothetical protein
VDHDRLYSWLGLPPGPWPPDHYARLGLPRGTAEVAEVEARVLERMERLRPHQLLHPELVTEGMNRLAQALVCLTDPVARAAHDRELGIPPPPFEVVAEPKPEPAAPPGEAPADEGPAEVPFTPGLLPPGAPQQHAYEVVREPEAERDPDPLPYKVAPYEVVQEELPPRPAFEVVPEEEVYEPEFLPEGAHEADGGGKALGAPAPVNRRAIYRRLAAARRALRAWEGLRPVLGTPAETLGTPVAVLLFVRALAEARDALPGVAEVILEPGSPGGTVAALVRLPHALHAVRVLLPAQRLAVARDWRRGHEELLRERRRLRRAVEAARPPRRGGALAQALHAVRRTPEWVLLGALFVALLFALLRRKP